MYVLQDNSFMFLTKASQDRQYLEASPKFVAVTCGLVRGSLTNLGMYNPDRILYCISLFQE